MKLLGDGDAQAWAYKLATFTFAFVVIVSALSQVYQTTTGKGQASAALSDNMKSAMLVLSGMLAASKQPAHKNADEPSGSEKDPSHVMVDNTKDDAVPVETKKEGK